MRFDHCAPPADPPGAGSSARADGARAGGAAAGGARADGTRPDGRPALPVVALVGRPNVGKSTLFAAATGRYAESTNAPGTTVSAERRRISTREGEALLVDLPGTLSLLDTPTGADPFWTALLAAQPDAILLVADAGEIGRHLPMALACRDLGLPLVVAANLADEAHDRGVEIDAGRLSQLLAAPVHIVTGRTGEGVADTVARAVRLAKLRRARLDGAAPHATIPAAVYGFALEQKLGLEAASVTRTHSLGAAALDNSAASLSALVADRVISPRGAASLRLGEELEGVRWRIGSRWAEQVEHRGSVPPRLADRLAVAATAPWPGLPLFVGVTAAAFVAMLAAGGFLSAALTGAWSATASPALTAAIRGTIPNHAVAGAVLWGVDGGVLALLSVGIPYILTFYLLLAVLEDSGYLTSAAVLTDRLFNVLGLPGRAAIPLLAASGCNVPAIYGTRVLPTHRERLLGAFLVTMVPCSARSAVVVAALAPFAGPWVALGAFALIAAITFGAGIAANAIVPGRQPALVLELAPLRRPVLRLVWRKAWSRFSAFVRSAAPLMLIGSILLGFLYESGLIWSVSAVLDPVIRGWLGLPSVAGLALLFAFLRKELALQLLVALAVVQFGAGAASLGSFMTPGQLFVYAIVTSVSVPCVATLAALRGEFGWRAAIAMSASTLGIALAAGGAIARVIGVA